MKINKIFEALRKVLLILIIVAIFFFISEVFERKTIYGAWNTSLKVNGFTNEPEESMDIIGYGSSHMYCTLNPVYVYEKYGLRSYSLATQQQPVDATYYYIKESLKTQSPELLVVEAYMFIATYDVVTEAVAHDAVDPFPNGINKLMMINALNTEDAKTNYYINFLKYHSRWKELTSQDFDFSWKKETDPTHGYVFLTDVKQNCMSQISYDGVEEVAILEHYEEVFLDIVQLAEENGTEVLLLIAPYNVEKEELGRYKYMHRLAEENGVNVLDLNLEFDATGISNDTDFYDSGHLNVYGAEKASSYMIDYIKRNYEIVANEVDDTSLWLEDIDYYYDRLQGK